MKTLMMTSVLAGLLAASSVSLLAESVPAPGRIAIESEAAFSANAAPALSSPAIHQDCIAQIREKHEQNMNRIWVGSMLAMAVASGFDAGSSWGKHEGNAFLASSDGTFGAKGLSLKAGITAGTILPQILLRHHQDFKGKFAILNFAAAGVFTGVGIHNLEVAEPK